MNHPQRKGLLIFSAAALLCFLTASSWLRPELAMGQSQSTDVKSQKMKERLEQLFIWRVSDKLELTPQEESKFRDEYHKITEEKSKLSEELDDVLDKIDKAKDDPAKCVKLLSDYEALQKKYDQLQSKEMAAMGHLFGTKRMVQYVLLKREMKQKFKDFLVSNNGPRTASKDEIKPTLKEPEVYQEK